MGDPLTRGGKSMHHNERDDNVIRRAARRATAMKSTAAVIASLAAASLCAGSAAAAPTGNDNWLRFEGTCNGQQIQFVDPPGPGPSNFSVGGTVGVGMRFLSTNLATGEILEERVYGRGVDEGR